MLGTTLKFKEGVTSEEAAKVLLKCVEAFPHIIDAEDLESIDWQGAEKAGGCPVSSLPEIPKCAFCSGGKFEETDGLSRPNATHMDSVNGFPCCAYHKAKDVSRTHIHEILPKLVPIRSDESLEMASDIAGRLAVLDVRTPEQQSYLDVLTLLIEDYEKQRHLW